MTVAFRRLHVCAARHSPLARARRAPRQARHAPARRRVTWANARTSGCQHAEGSHIDDVYALVVWRADCGVLTRGNIEMTWSRPLIVCTVVAALAGVTVMTTRSAAPPLTSRDEGRAPGFDGVVDWLNSPPLSGRRLQGKVVLVYFWTYTCINSLRPLPFVKSWAARYRDAGLVVVGVHTPEFSFEHEHVNVETAVRALGVEFPVAIDSRYKVWDAFHNQYWPAFYIVDVNGRI